jgi:hypothetical protein
MATEAGRSPQALFQLVGLDQWQAVGNAFQAPDATGPAPQST